MAMKINLNSKDGKTYKLEGDFPVLIDKEIGETIKGEELDPKLKGYEFEIKAASDRSGFIHLKTVEGAGLKKVLLEYGPGMKKRPRHEGKKKHTTMKPKGLRLRKTVRGKLISEATRQVNMVTVKGDSKKLSEIFAPAPVEDKSSATNPHSDLPEEKPAENTETLKAE